MLSNAAASGLDYVQGGYCFLGNGQKYFDGGIKTFYFIFYHFLFILFFFSTHSENLMQATHALWELIKIRMHLEVEKPSLHMTKHQLKKLTYDQAERMKEKVDYQLLLSLFANLNTKKSHIYFKIKFIIIP